MWEDTLPQGSQWGLPEDQGKEEEDQVGAQACGPQLRDSGRKSVGQGLPGLNSMFKASLDN